MPRLQPQECMTEVMTEGIAPRRAAIQERTQQCMTAVMTEGIELPRVRGARQPRRREAIQERTQECMTAVMIEGIAPCGGPKNPQLPRARGARQQPRRAAIQERTQECMTELMAVCKRTLRGSRRSLQSQGTLCQWQQPQRAATQERTQEGMTAVMIEGIAPCGGPGGASIAKGSRRKAATPQGGHPRADSRMHDCGHD